MDPYILATKLRIPPQPHHVVRRPRLVDALERGIPDYKLVLISAPAGYGKTTLLSQWAHTSRFPVAWLSISEEDNELERFLRYLFTGWEQIQPSITESPAGLLLSGMEPDTEAVLSAFVNAANDLPDHMVFVLDDYHLIEDQSIHHAVTFMLDHLPPKLHFVLAGRGAPPLPLARYRARHELLEFRTEELYFRVEETGDFLNRKMGLNLTPDEVVPLQTELEGWIAGLQLVSLTLHRHPEAVGKLVVHGRNRFIVDYLSEDVIAHLPEDVRRFLLQTSILDPLSGSLCDAVTEETNGQQMLERLERDNLFLVALDDSREWFRYHHLFADFLQGELRQRHPDDAVTLHRRAAKWYLAHDMPEQALHHAVEHGDVELVIRIFELYIPIKMAGGEVSVVKRWFELLPEAWHSAHPMIGVAQASILLFTGQFEAGLRCLEEVDRLMLAQGEGMRQQRARVTALRCFVACNQRNLEPAEAFAQQALRDLPEEDLTLRNGIYGSLGDTYRSMGRWDEAKECYLKTLDLTPASTFHVQSVLAFGALADLDLRQGHLQGAAAYWRRALAIISDRRSWGSLPLPLIGWVFTRMGEVLYEWNELEEASDYISQGLERAELGGDVQARIASYVIAGRLKLTVGDIAAAGEYLERARPLVGSAPLPDWIGRFERFQVEFWLAHDRLRTAVDWADDMLRGDALEVHAESEESQLAAARVLIVKGDVPSLERAVAQLRHLLQLAEAEGRTGVIIEALALQALAYWKRGEQAGAMTSLERALRMAEPEGYVRRIADLGLPMARLLQEARSRGVMPDYVGKLLAVFGGDVSSHASAEGALPEPLSVREQEVLQLIAAGLTNREIAEALVVSPETVKKHTSSIFGKLGVSKRTQAVARARELDLLG